MFVANVGSQFESPNPLMKVPTLVDNGTNVIESDHIARYVVAKYGPQDEFEVCICLGVFVVRCTLIITHEIGEHLTLGCGCA